MLRMAFAVTAEFLSEVLCTIVDPQLDLNDVSLCLITS